MVEIQTLWSPVKMKQEDVQDAGLENVKSGFAVAIVCCIHCNI